MEEMILIAATGFTHMAMVIFGIGLGIWLSKNEREKDD